jgi:hypothetical protein
LLDDCYFAIINKYGDKEKTKKKKSKKTQEEKEDKKNKTQKKEITPFLFKELKRGWSPVILIG